MNKHFLSIGLMVSSAFSFIQADSGCTAQTGCAKIANCNSDCTVAHNTWLPRAFSSYSSRNMIQEKPVFQVESNRDEWNGTFSATTEYMRNFGQKCNSCKNLGALPFWSGTNVMTVGNNNTDGSNLDAYQFGLGDLTIGNDDKGNPKFGTITLDPRVQHVGTDFLLYFTQHKDARGLFFKLNAPLGAMIINPRLTEEGIVPNGLETSMQTLNNVVNNSLNGPVAITYEQESYPAVASRPQTMSEALIGGNGCCATTLSSQKITPLKFGRIAPGRQSVVRFADLSMSLGYNVWGSDKGILGVAFKGTCPTGNVPTAEYMLEPIFGRAGAWGIGAEVMGHYKVWENDAQTRYLDIWMQGEVLHLMPGRTPNYRSFDLKQNGPGSKYLLIQYYEANFDATTQAEERTAGALQQAINITTLPVISKIKAEGSVAVGFDFHCNNWNAALIGEFWGRTSEKLKIDMCSATELRLQNLNDYAVVGRQVSAYDAINTPTTGASILGTPPVSIDALLCEPKAMICKSQSALQLDGSDDGAGLITILNPTESDSYTLPAGIADATQAANRIPAVLDDALDIDGAAAARAMTGKLSGQIGYTFAEHRYTPHVSIFGGVEMTPRCSNNAMQYWSAGIQASLNF